MSNTRIMNGNTAIIPEAMYNQIKGIKSAWKNSCALHVLLVTCEKKKPGETTRGENAIFDEARSVFTVFHGEDGELIFDNTKSVYGHLLEPITVIPSSETNQVSTPEQPHKISRDVLDFELLRLKSLFLAASTERDGMRSENRQRRRFGLALAYDDDDFADLAERIQSIVSDCQEVIDAIKSYDDSIDPDSVINVA